ncbi:MAG TPA: hypothetical protein GX513_06820 [Firmicutes bacterium]|nr:hypothetical protein [Bacillota bacterium]
MTDLVELLEKFSGIACPPTGEKVMHTAIAGELQGAVDELFADSMGNLIATVRGPAEGPVLMIEAHIDEVALMVSSIESTGVLRFEKLGWIDDRSLPARLVDVHTGRGVLPGVLGMSGSEDRSQAVPYTRLYVDVGAGSAAEARELGVRVGDTITLKGSFVRLPGGLVSCRAVDDRVGVAVIVSALQQLQGRRDYTLVATFATQHEVGLRGPAVAAYRVDPDACLVIDVTGNSADVGQQAVRMGGGPVFRVMEEYGTNVAFGAQKGLFAHPELQRFVMDVADKASIPYQVQVRRGSIGDGVAVHLAREGVPTASMLIPVRYSHTAQEVCHPDDLTMTRDLLMQVLGATTGEWIRSLAGKRLI